MTVSSVSICSNALLLVGGQSINSFDDTNDRTRLVANLYPFVRDETLRSHPWKSCTKRVLLAPEAIAPGFDYGFQFLLPPDCIKVLQVGLSGYRLDYQLEGRAILADVKSLPLVYVFLNEVETTYDPGLVNLLTLKMAARIAYPITQSAALAQQLAQAAEVERKRTQAVDGQDSLPETLGDFRLLQVRSG